MKRRLTFSSVFTAMTIFNSCETVVDVDIPFDGKQLTINSFFSPDSVWKAEITRNRYILDSDPFERVSDAIVTIQDEGVITDTLKHTGNGYYRSDKKPVAGKYYRISATHPDNGTATCESYAPLAAQITDGTFETSPGENGRTLRATFNITFQDDPAIENFYEVNVQTYYQFLDPYTKTIQGQYSKLRLTASDPLLKSGLADDDQRILLKDVFYPGTTITLSFSADMWFNDAAGVHVSLRTVSEAYYKYRSTSNLQKQTAGDPFAQPANVFENIQNGLGIFAGFCQTTKSFTGTPFKILEVSADRGHRGEEITILLDKNLTDIRTVEVIFESTSNIIHATVSGKSGATIRAIIPALAVSGRIWIRAGGFVVEWDREFIVMD